MAKAITCLHGRSLGVSRPQDSPVAAGLPSIWVTQVPEDGNVDSLLKTHRHPNNDDYYHNGHRSLKRKAANFRLTAENIAGSEEEYKTKGTQW